MGEAKNIYFTCLNSTMSQEFRDSGVGTDEVEDGGLFDPVRHGLETDFRLTKHTDLKG